MSHIPSELRYTSTHEWVRLEENNEAVVGITYHAQAMLGDMVFVELPELGSALLEGDDVAVAESVKAATDVYTPVSGIVVGINDELEASPEQINQDPYGAGWLFRVKLEEVEELEGLMDAESYQQMLENELD
jgi:glycine cleavage system H protein